MTKASSGTSWQNCTCGCRRGQDQGEQIPVRVESVDKVDRSTLAVDCTEADFRTTFENAPYQVLRRATTNEPPRMVQQVQGQRGFEAWHLIVRRYDQRNTSNLSSAYAALNSNISERDRAKDAEQLDDILRNIINETNKYEEGFGNLRDEEKILAVNKLMLEILLNYRLRGSTLPHEEVLIALENIIIDKGHDTFGIQGEEKLTRAHQWRSAWPQEPMVKKRPLNCTGKHLKTKETSARKCVARSHSKWRKDQRLG